MSDTNNQNEARAATSWKSGNGAIMLAATSIMAIGLVAGGYLLGDGLTRAKIADRSVTVRGLAEREVMADLATWTLSYSSTARSMDEAQANVDQDTDAIIAFFGDLEFPEDAIQPTGVNVSSSSRNGIVSYTVRQRMTLRSRDIERSQRAVRSQFELVRRGVMLEEGSGMDYTFTKLNEIKPEMVADATRDARASAQQFADDSGTGVGSIKSATQGYFSINARDGDGGGWGVADTPYKKVRVVTTVAFSLG